MACNKFSQVWLIYLVTQATGSIITDANGITVATGSN